MADNPTHFTPLPDDVIPKRESSFTAKNKVALIILGLLVMVALILGVLFYLNNSSVKPAPQESMTPSTPVSQPSPLPEEGSDEVSTFSDDASIQLLSCNDGAKYKARLDQIGMVCTAGCCPWESGYDGKGCKAPADGECKPKGNPCSDGTCWECRSESKFQLLRYRDGQWVSCSEAPTPTPTIAPIATCPNPNQCIPLNECETPPPAANPAGKCANNLYCCKPKPGVTVTVTPSPTPVACVKPKLDIEVQCLLCDGEAITQ
ncbi:hypothetical protein KBD09_00355 [Candidatus Woesebacteria bacterium]|nr:hypothetical protein [Candidatus Woesebacteria bacterium]